MTTDRTSMFPSTIPNPYGHSFTSDPGLTKRDFFAAAALQAIVSKTEVGYVAHDDASNPLFDEAAHGAYAYADAMLAARKR